MYVFRDIDPDAAHHYQMIPKWHLRNLNSLDQRDPLHLTLVKHLRERSLSLMREWHPEEVGAGQYKFGFHKPWCTSIDHLHMHMMVGRRRPKAYIQFNCMFFRSIEEVCRRMER